MHERLGDHVTQHDVGSKASSHSLPLSHRYFIQPWGRMSHLICRVCPALLICSSALKCVMFVSILSHTPGHYQCHPWHHSHCFCFFTPYTFMTSVTGTTIRDTLDTTSYCCVLGTPRNPEKVCKQQQQQQQKKMKSKNQCVWRHDFRILQDYKPSLQHKLSYSNTKAATACQA
jgi:hypothetical protein